MLAYTYSYTDDQVTSVTATADNFSNTFGYQYDTEGRITDYSSSNGISDKYTYGNKGQVIRNDHRGIEDDTTFTFSYDNRGNIRHQKQYDYTTDSLSGETVNDDLQFSYDYDNDVWLDAVDVMGEGDDAVPIIYDANGNQVEISNVRYHWTNGRQLSSVTYIDDEGAEQPFMSFTYDDNGIRTSKTFGDTTTYYTNVDGAITSQYCLDGDGAVTDLMQFLYDGSNDLLGFTYNGATYFYVKNLQGDVIAVIDSTGTEKAVYEYGAYGRLIYSDGDLADVNPMRYRGYYYDSDFGGYYLQSRYYAPEFAKFINSDLPEYAQQQKADHYGTNLFAYCCNDPVNNSDPTGYWKKGKHNKITYDIAKKYFTKKVAKKIANYCKKLDEDYPSSAYAKNFLIHPEEKIWQYYHFNGYKKGYYKEYNGTKFYDSRKYYAEVWLKKAEEYAKSGKKESAYKWFGYSLHCLQDIAAHGQIGRGTEMPQHVVSSDNKLLHKADKNHYEWTDNECNALKYVKGSTVRIDYAKKMTKKRIYRFVNDLRGYWKYEDGKRHL